MLLIVVNPQSTDYELMDMTDLNTYGTITINSTTTTTAMNSTTSITTMNSNRTTTTTVISSITTTTMSNNTTSSNSTGGSTGVSIQQDSIITPFSIIGILFLTLKYVTIYSK